MSTTLALDFFPRAHSKLYDSTMRLLFGIVTLAGAVAAQTGSSIVVNGSPDPFFVWVVPNAAGAPIGDRIKVDAGESLASSYMFITFPWAAFSKLLARIDIEGIVLFY